MKIFFGRQNGNTSYDVGDGPAAVEENRRLVAARFDLPLDRLFAPKQVHGDTIIRVDEKSSASEIAKTEADAIWTTSPRVIVAVNTADCVPVLMAHRNNAGVMAIHLGWKGSAIGLAAKAVRHLCEHLSASPNELIASIGPCIGFEVYEVGYEVVEALSKTVSSMEGCVRELGGEKWLVDTGAVVERQLYEAGVRDIQNMKMCTMQNGKDYFSHRGDKGASGRQMSAIMI